MKKIKEFLKNKKGNFSVLFVILCLIGVLIVTAMADILKESYVLNEIQGIMDVAGVSALNASVDKQALREEQFKYDKDTLITTYHDIINQRINTGDLITYKRIIKTEVKHDISTQGLGDGSKPSNQLWLDSVMLVRVKTSAVFDVLPGMQKQFYDSKSNSKFTVQVNGKTEDGNTELIIRSVSRLVYR